MPMTGCSIAQMVYSIFVAGVSGHIGDKKVKFGGMKLSETSDRRTSIN